MKKKKKRWVAFSDFSLKIETERGWKTCHFPETSITSMWILKTKVGPRDDGTISKQPASSQRHIHIRSRVPQKQQNTQ